MRSTTADTLYRYLPVWCSALVIVLAIIALPLLQRNLWTDEAFSASYTSHSSIGALLDDVRKNEETPPGYFVLLWGWSKLAGQSEVALRAFSFLCGLAAVALFGVLARRWLAPAEAIAAAWVFALAPVLARYLVEVRGYTLLLLLALLCIAAFERAYRDPSRPVALVLYVVSAAALFLTTYFGAALILAHNLIWGVALLRQHEDWRRRLVGWCVAMVALALLILPWLPSLLYQMRVAPAVSPFQNAQPIHYFWLVFMLPMHTPPSTAWGLVWIVLAVACWGLIAIAMRHPLAAYNGLLVRIFGIPALTLLGLIVWMQAIGPRYLLTLLPGTALAIGVGWGQLRQAKPRMAEALAVVCALGLLVYRLAGPAMPPADRPWTALLARLTAQADPAGDAVLLHPPYEQRTFAYYYRGPALKLLGANDYDDFYYAQGHVLRTAWTIDEAVQATQGSRRVWLLYNPLLGAPRISLPYRLVDHWRSGDLELALYDVQGK
jgi:hypothetical protein